MGCGHNITAEPPAMIVTKVTGLAEACAAVWLALIPKNLKAPNEVFVISWYTVETGLMSVWAVDCFEIAHKAMQYSSRHLVCLMSSNGSKVRSVSALVTH